MGIREVSTLEGGFHGAHDRRCLSDPNAVMAVAAGVGTSPLPQLQLFDAPILALRAVWSNCAVASGHRWVRIGANQGSDSAPFEIGDQNGLRAIAKPGVVKPDVSRAAHEKIVADLAALLDFPVPPVTLTDLGAGWPGDRYVAISAFAFPSCEPWGPRIEGQMTAAQKSTASAPFSAMRALETLVSADDRKADHVLVNSSLGQGPVALGFIDYAFSLSRQWPGPNAAVGAPPLYMPVPFDAAVAGAACDSIAGLDDLEIKEIVTRIGTDWLPIARRDAILSNLLSRKTQLKTILGLP